MTGLAALQIALGFANVILLAPVWLQLLHLLVADAIWIGFVLLGAEALSQPSPVRGAGWCHDRPRGSSLGVRA